MATNYPGSIDSLTNPSPGAALTSPSHSAQHANANDAIEAIETELGTTPKGSAASVKARLDGIENGTRLAAGSVMNAALASGIDGAKLSPGIGNLLTANQASGTDTLGDTTGFASYDATLSRSTAWAAQGSGSLLVTATGTGVAVDISPAGTAGIQVTPGETVTATATVKGGTSTDALALRIIFWDSGGSVVSYSETYVTLSGTPQTPTVTATVPAGAAFVSLVAVGDSMTSGDTCYIDKAGLWRGAGGTWAMPGVPIPGQSRIAVNNAVDLSGTGSPEGVVTAAPGSSWLQIGDAVTVSGNLLWRKTSGTGNTGWTPEGALADTGPRDVTASLLNGWVGYGGSGKLILRRIGNVVYLTGCEPGLNAASKTSNLFYNPPSGFTVLWKEVGGYGMCGVAFDQGNTNALAPIIRESGSGLTVIGPTTAWTNTNTMTLNAQWRTDDAWPSSLPGSAV